MANKSSTINVDASLLVLTQRDMGKAIRAGRTRAGMTQEGLATATDLTANFIAHLERGSRGASLATLVSLAWVLGMRLPDFFSAAPPAPVQGKGSPGYRELCAVLRRVPESSYRSILAIARGLERPARS